MVSDGLRPWFWQAKMLLLYCHWQKQMVSWWLSTAWYWRWMCFYFLRPIEPYCKPKADFCLYLAQTFHQLLHVTTKCIHGIKRYLAYVSSRLICDLGHQKYLMSCSVICASKRLSFSIENHQHMLKKRDQIFCRHVWLFFSLLLLLLNSFIDNLFFVIKQYYFLQICYIVKTWLALRYMSTDQCVV